MAVNVSKSDGNTTFTFTITALSTKIDPLIAKWAEYDYNHGFGQVYTEVDGEQVLTPFDDLTNAQKMAVINARIKAVGIAEANQQENDDAKAALEPTTYDLDGVDA